MLGDCESLSSSGRPARWIAAGALLLAACLIDDERCGENQVESVERGSVGACLCGPNAVPKPGGIGCMLCGVNEERRGNSCACQAGFARDPAGVCIDATLVDAGTPAGDSGAAPADPTGQGLPCTTSADCSAYDAKFCTPVDPPACVVDGCAAADVACGTGYVCCQIDLLGMFGARLNSICIPTSRLDDGQCPYSGTLVPK